ncbi:MAG: RHS repeat-associated core domain-containing protein [Desulfovibrio sp.]
MERKYSLQLERGGQGRITAKNENVNGWPVSWEYRYDGAGRLAGVNRDGAGVELYIYDAQGRRAEDYVPLRGQMDRVFRYGPDNRLLQAGEARYEHDERGFRSRKVTPQGETRYHYAPDYRLLAVELPDGRVVEYGHDDQGLRNAKYVNGRLTEQFRWYDRAHLAAWSHVDVAGGQWWEVVYGRDGRPMGLVTQDQVHSQGQHAEILLHTDQIGCVRVVEFPTEGMVKEILYDAFGNVVRDGNPYLRTPLGFAGGLHDWDTGLIRFGWRDYDPDTGRFTAKDPIGAAGGDSDWYGYCLDDPINGRDPRGLETAGVGAYGNVTVLTRQVGGDVKYVWDDKGNRGVAVTGSVGWSPDLIGASGGVAGEKTNAQDIQQLNGEAGSVGGTITPLPGVSSSATGVKGPGYSGAEIRGGGSAGLGLPAGPTATRDYTVVVPWPFD